MRRFVSMFVIAIILLTSPTTSANEYLHCDSVVESNTDSVMIVSTRGSAGDTISVYFRSTTVDDVVAFFLLIRFESSRIYPVTYSGSFVEVEPLGRLKTVMDTSTTGSFFAQISPNPADSGALAVLFNISPEPFSEMPPGNGDIFRVPFVIGPPQPQTSQLTPLWFHEINETFEYGDSTFTVDCRRSMMATTDESGTSISLFPTMVPGTLRAIDPSLASVTATLTAGGFSSDSLQTGVAVEWTLNFTNNSGFTVGGSTNGFRLWSPNGGTWDTLQAISLGVLEPMYDGGVFINTFSMTGSGADTIGIGGFCLFGPCIHDGFSADVFILQTSFPAGQDGVQVCLDSAWYPPGGAWLWSSPGGSLVPAWNGPLCYTLHEPACRSCGPIFDNCPLNLGALDHCQDAMTLISATDPSGYPITLNQLSGPGTLTDNGDGTGVWSYTPTIADVGISIPTVTFEACNPFACSPPCGVDMTFTNQAPVFTGGCGTWPVVCAGGTGSAQLTADPVDCDPISFFLSSVSPTPVGTIAVDPLTGEVTFNSDPADAGAGMVFDVWVGVTDGLDTAFCNVQFDILFCEAFEVAIEKTHNTIQGGHELVDIIYDRGTEPIGGFDFLIAYDASALALTAASEGSIFSKCGWEYFTYRYSPIGNCSGCPSGSVRIVGIAETNNGPSHPVCFLMETGDTFATLDFLVSDDRTLECQYVPIRFYWQDCGDNTISSVAGDTAFIDRKIYDFTGLLLWDEDDDDEFPEDARPTGLGAPDYCLNPDPEKPSALRFIDFINGGVDIVCTDSIDARGDVNLNDIANEIADAVLFSNYFVHGLSVFNVNLEGQIAATDVNADGLTLTVGDLVYLIRIIVGDALPLPKTSPVEMEWTASNNVLSVAGTIGAAAIVMSGNVVPELLAPRVEMLYNFDGTNTRILLYSMVQDVTIMGDFLKVSGDVVSVEMATYEGAPVAAKATPSTYRLHQNYPNPFNPVTTISFQLAQAGKYQLDIFNVAGQKVTSFTGMSSAGTTEVAWDATGIASGVYYYRLTAGDFTDTKKMLLLK